MDRAMQPSRKTLSFVKKISPPKGVAHVAPLSRNQGRAKTRKRFKPVRVSTTTHKRISRRNCSVVGDSGGSKLLSVRPEPGLAQLSSRSEKSFTQTEKTPTKSERTCDKRSNKVTHTKPIPGHQKHVTRKQIDVDIEPATKGSRINKKSSVNTSNKGSPQKGKINCIIRRIQPLCVGSKSSFAFAKYLTELIDYQVWLAGKIGALEKELQFAVVRYDTVTSTGKRPGMVVVGMESRKDRPLDNTDFLNFALSQMSSKNNLSKAICTTDEETQTSLSMRTSESCRNNSKGSNSRLESSQCLLSLEDHDSYKGPEYPNQRQQPNERCEMVNKKYKKVLQYTDSEEQKTSSQDISGVKGTFWPRYLLQYILLFVITLIQCFLLFLSPFDDLK